jgi:hypothetical protein
MAALGDRMSSMARAATKKVTSLPWPEIDKIELSAGWIRNGQQFFVQRKHDGIIRGHWEFEHAEKNQWKCIRAGAHYLRDRLTPAHPDPRDVDDSRVPADIELKAKEFLAAEVKIAPRTEGAG